MQITVNTQERIGILYSSGTEVKKTYQKGGLARIDLDRTWIGREALFSSYNYS